MNKIKKTEIMKSVYGRNDEAAADFNKFLTGKKIFCVNVLGSPGAGKTTLLIDLIGRLIRRSFVIEGDVASDIDARRLAGQNIPAAQINTGGACHLNAAAVADCFHNSAGGFIGGYLFIENIGNLICPVDFFLGEHAKMLVCSVTEGGDKSYKYPLAFERADVIVINKSDLSAHVDFDEKFFSDGARMLNQTAPIFTVSGVTGAGVSEVAEWLTYRAAPVTG